MPINFTQLFQDSWNFIRNQRRFTMAFTVAFTLLLLTMNLLAEPIAEQNIVAVNSQMSDKELLDAFLQNIDINSFAFFYTVNQLLFLLISSWGILTIHHISQGNHYPLATTFTLTLRRFLGVVVLNILIALPLLVSVGSILLASFSGGSSSVFGLFSMFFAIFVFIRLCLAPVSYLIGEKNLSQSVSFIWQQGSKRTLTLLLYCLIVYFVLQWIVQKLSLLADNLVMAVIATLFISFLSVFSLVITYRFYNLFTQKA